MESTLFSLSTRALPFFFLNVGFLCSFTAYKKKKKKRICGKLEIMQQRSSLNHILISSMHKFWAMNYIFCSVTRRYILSFFKVNLQYYDKKDN